MLKVISALCEKERWQRKNLIRASAKNNLLLAAHKNIIYVFCSFKILCTILKLS